MHDRNVCTALVHGKRTEGGGVLHEYAFVGNMKSNFEIERKIAEARYMIKTGLYNMKRQIKEAIYRRIRENIYDKGRGR